MAPGTRETDALKRRPRRRQREQGHPEAAAAPHSGEDEGEDPFDTDAAEIRSRSILAFKHGATHKEVDEGKFPTNDQVVQALQLKVAKSVDIARRYRRVLWYSLFVAVYLIVLYLQASAYKSADVVSTLRNALMVDGQLSMTFNNEDEVLAYIGNKILLPTWQDPVCGDGQCEYPWEFPAFGRFGCESDCGVTSNTTKIAVNIRADFTGHATISPRVLMSSVRWNLCLNDEERTARGEADLCWWESDQTFTDVKVNRIESADVTDGEWYVIIRGDYTGRVTGSVFDLSNPSEPEPVELTPTWEKCKLPESTGASTSARLRKLLTAFKTKRDEGDKDPDLLRNLRQDIFPELPPLNETLGPEELKAKLASLADKRKEIEAMKQKLKRAKGTLKPEAVQHELTHMGAIEDEEE